MKLLPNILSPRQHEAVEKLVSPRGGIVWWKVGEGKTRIAIAWFLRICEESPVPTGYCLIVCRRKSFQDWYDEIKRVCPDAQVFTDEAPRIPPTGRYAFLLISDGKLVTLQTKCPIKAVVLDEGWLYANPTSQRSKVAQQLTESRPSLLLSGTMMKARDLLELYAQAKAVNKHHHVARSITQFRTKYQIVQNTFGFPTYHPKAGSKAKVVEALSDVIDVHFPESTREIRNQFHNIEPTKQQLELFDELQESFSATIGGDEHEFNNALTTIVKAQQIANGWFLDPDGRIHSVETNKVAKLQDELDSIVGAGEKCIVWCAFRHDVKMLASALPFATVQMLGGEKFDTDKWNRPDVKVCLASQASGSAVNHFSQTPYALYFSANFKWKDMQQSRGRTERKSSRHTTCYYKYLQVVDSFDSHVYQTALGSGDDESSLISLVNSLKNWLK